MVGVVKDRSDISMEELSRETKTRVSFSGSRKSPDILDVKGGSVVKKKDIYVPIDRIEEV